MPDTPQLVVVCGLPGAGKTTVAEAVANRLAADLLRTDVVRKELFPDPNYTAEESRRAYEALLDRADAILATGETAVLDGTFRRAQRRQWAHDLGSCHDVDVRVVHVTCDEAVAKRRIRAREGDASDADVEVYDLLREEFEPPADPVVVDNSGDLAATRARVRELF